MHLLTPGTLWERILQTSERAIVSGALVPIPTNSAFIDDAGVRFSVRVLDGLRRKAEARQEQDAAERAGKNANPFFPPEQDLTVGDITESHIAVLNKFNVVDHHLLIVTRQFEEQETLLTLADAEALCICMAEYPSLGFYNGGAEGGASQRHKHLQVVPLPLAPEVPSLPVAPLLAQAVLDREGMGTLPGFPFRHAFARIEQDAWRSSGDAARSVHRIYAALLERAGMRQPAGSGLIPQSGPYCLLVDRTWMLLVPRSKEHFEKISFNSLAYAGSLFVYNEALLARLREYGPMNALRLVGFPL